MFSNEWHPVVDWALKMEYIDIPFLTPSIDSVAIYLPTYLPTYLPNYPPSYCLSTYLPTYLPKTKYLYMCLSTYLPTAYLPTDLRRSVA